MLGVSADLLGGARWFNQLRACVAAVGVKHRKQAAPAYEPVTITSSRDDALRE
jgi:hypothetical protein